MVVVRLEPISDVPIPNRNSQPVVEWLKKDWSVKEHLIEGSRLDLLAQTLRILE